jgi:diguanylate cyclase (GGDEF)-like protein
MACASWTLPGRLAIAINFAVAIAGKLHYAIAYWRLVSDVFGLVSMQLNFNALPSLIAIAILVAVFAAISRQHIRERIQFWLVGWALVLLRSVMQFAHLASPRWSNVNLAISLNSLMLASMAFLVSVAPKATTLRRQLVLAAVLGVPALAYTNAMIWDVTAHSFYYTLLILALAAEFLLLWRWHRAITPYVICIAAGSIVLLGFLAWGLAKGQDDYGLHIILAALNFFTAGLFWYRFRRHSAGVMVTVFGFVAWGLTFPAGLSLQQLAPSVHVQSEIWNIPKYLVAVGMIVTLLEEQIQQSVHLAYHDALTGLPNRRLLQDRLVQALAHADRAGHKVAVLLLDLDDFKEVNDTFGHRVGDAALQQVVTRLASRMRASDTLARTGGDEFTVVSEVTAPHGAETLVAALESALILPIKVEGRLVRTGVSIGYALYPEDGADPLALCSAADKAMYDSKRISRSLKSSPAS